MRNVVPPGPGTIEANVVVGSSASGNAFAGVNQTTEEENPGVCSNAFDQGGHPSCATIDLRSLSWPVTRRRTVMRGSSLSHHLSRPVERTGMYVISISTPMLSQMNGMTP